MKYALLLYDDPTAWENIDEGTMASLYLVDAENEERALELAAKIPTVSRMGGAIEVRPIVER